MDRSRQLIVALLTGAALGVGAIVLQRWVAQTFQIAVALVVVWFAVVTIAAVIYSRGRPEVRRVALGTVAVIGLVSAAAGYWTGVRKDDVDENVPVASNHANDDQRAFALAGMGTTQMIEGDGAERDPSTDRRLLRPVKLADGQVSGADGHAGEGTARVVEEPSGGRALTLTEFDVDAGPDVNVYLSTATAGIDDAVDLGDLKGERGDQQYEIPNGLDLTKYDDLVLWCIPFTTRIATAELR